MKCLQLGLSILLLGAPATAVALPRVDYVDRYDSSISGEPVVSVDVFYDQLSPYGVWVDDPVFGRVFVPDLPRFVPYVEGRWELTNVGFVWISSEPFAWATTHYGRWVYSQAFQRWVWRPDTVWGPSWVEWRQDGDYFGWAPLGPDLPIRYSPPLGAWHYLSARYLFAPNVSRYYEPPRRIVDLHRRARPVQRYANIGGARVVVGPSPATLRGRRVDVRRTVIDPLATGRWTPAEARALVRGAQERRGANEALNRQRIERTPGLRRPPQIRQEPQQRPQLRQQPRQPPQVQRQPPQVQRPSPQVRQELRQPPLVRQDPRRPRAERRPERR